MKLFKRSLTSRVQSGREVRALAYDYRLHVGHACKWGGRWDIAIYGKLIPTNLRSLDWTAEQWISFIQDYQKDPYLHSIEELTKYVLKNGS